MPVFRSPELRPCWCRPNYPIPCYRRRRLKLRFGTFCSTADSWRLAFPLPKRCRRSFRQLEAAGVSAAQVCIADAAVAEVERSPIFRCRSWWEVAALPLLHVVAAMLSLMPKKSPTPMSTPRPISMLLGPPPHRPAVTTGGDTAALSSVNCGCHRRGSTVITHHRHPVPTTVASRTPGFAHRWQWSKQIREH